MQFDNAVVLVGTAIENAAQEQHNVGSDKEPDWQAKYTMEQLLDDDFRLPAPPTKADSELKAGRQFASLPGVRVVKAKASMPKDKE